MQARFRLSVFVLFVGISMLSPSISSSQEIKIGILANRGFTAAAKQWTATAQYLTSKLGKPVAVFPMDDKTLVEQVKEGKVDFFYTNSAMYVELNRFHNAQAIATLVNQVNSQPLDQWGAAVIVRRDSSINSLSDLKGKDFMCRGIMAFGGWLMAKRLFVDNGMDPEKDLKSLRSTATHDNVVWAVYNGAVDAGSVRTGTLEQMAQDGKIKLEDFRIIHQMSDKFPLVHSTQLYPEYPMAASAHVPQNVRTEVAQALLALSPSDAALTSAGIAGWKKPVDYSSVIDCLTVVQYGPFAKQAAKQ